MKIDSLILTAGIGCLCIAVGVMLGGFYESQVRDDEVAQTEAIDPGPPIKADQFVGYYQRKALVAELMETSYAQR